MISEFDPNVKIFLHVVFYAPYSFPFDLRAYSAKSFDNYLFENTCVYLVLVSLLLFCATKGQVVHD